MNFESEDSSMSDNINAEFHIQQEVIRNATIKHVNWLINYSLPVDGFEMMFSYHECHGADATGWINDTPYKSRSEFYAARDAIRKAAIEHIDWLLEKKYALGDTFCREFYESFPGVPSSDRYMHDGLEMWMDEYIDNLGAVAMLEWPIASAYIPS